MTLSGQSDSFATQAHLTIIGGPDEDASTVDVMVQIERVAPSRCALVINTPGSVWRLTFSPSAATFVAGVLAAGASVRFE